MVSAMTAQRRDLGASLHRLAGAVVAREVPVLREHDVEMWDYVVLAALEHGPAQTQAQLATAVRRDATRLIPILDRLAARGLLVRIPDADDRRNRVVSLTADGRSLFSACRASIRVLEGDLLGGLSADERIMFLDVLERLVASIG
jgi:DNA-binding MarR family transcriptional regulator